MIKIGTSGYSFPDWVGEVYPKTIKKESLGYLQKFKELMGAIPVVTEFRNIRWHNLETLDHLRELNMGHCIVDEPKLEGLMPFSPIQTSEIGYFRLHGRNPNWFDAPVSIRYDYLYTEKELKEFIKPIQDVDKKALKTLVFFNNCHAGSAAKNAIQLAKMLDAEFKSRVE